MTFAMPLCYQIKNELGWEPTIRLPEGFEATVDWYLDNEAWMNHITTGDYQKYYEKQYVKGKSRCSFSYNIYFTLLIKISNRYFLSVWFFCRVMPVRYCFFYHAT